MEHDFRISTKIPKLVNQEGPIDEWDDYEVIGVVVDEIM